MAVRSGDEAARNIAQKLSSNVYTSVEDLYAPLANNDIISVVLSSQSLIHAIPHLYNIAADKSALVVHVAAENSSSSSYGDFSNVMAVRQTGFALLSSSSVQEAQDLAAIAHLASLKTSTPFLHFYDSRRIAYESSTITTLSEETLSKLITSDDVEAYKAREKPTIPTSAYLRYKQKQPSQVDVYSAVQEAMAHFATVAGRQYSPFEYTGHNEAEQVIVAMGAGATVVERTVDHLLKSNPDAKIGVLKIRLYRPLIDTDIIQAIPKSVKSIAVLEPSHDYASTYNPLFLDITAAFQAAQDDNVEIVSGQYGVDAVDFTPSMVNAVFEHIAGQALQRTFVIGDQIKVEERHVLSVNAGSSEVVIVGEELAKAFIDTQAAVQAYAVEQNGVSVSHVRVLEDDVAPLPSLISDAKYVFLADPSADTPAAVEALATEGNVVIHGSWTVDELNKALSGSVKRLIAVKKASVYVADAHALIKNDDISLSSATQIEIPAEWVDAAAPATTKESVKSAKSEVPVETPYIKLLDQVFGDRLDIANATKSASIWAPDSYTPAANPEFGFGKFLTYSQQRARLIDAVEKLLSDTKTSDELHKSLSTWFLLIKSPKAKPEQVTAAADHLVASLEKKYPELLAQREFFYPKSNWLIGSESWATDLGQSGVHHVITSGENVNLLIVDTTAYSSPVEREQRKKDIGLYAMNYGSVYVASVAIYSSYTGVLHALIEADTFQGPSIVLAYLPLIDGKVNPIETLKETKVSVDNGNWPLYRWNPILESENKEPFTLDSERIKKDLESFLERENHLTMLVAQQPELAKTLTSSLESDVKARHEELKRKAREDYAKLLSGLSGNSNGPPLTVLFGSDNGNAEGVAKKVAARAKSRGLKTTLMALDDYSDVQDLVNESNVVIVCCTAGQGEFPSNSREFWKALNSLNVGDINLADVKFGIFGLGDSHYWPREEDAIYYNRPAKLLAAKLDNLGAGRLTELGLGDDQDADGFDTGFQAWQPELWKALGIPDVGGEEEPPKITDNQMKINSNFLRGTIAQDLLDESTGAISETNGKLLKFHGSYGQDDRDIREERKKQGLEKAFSFMIRVRMPGGTATSEQWLAMDELASNYANGALKLTTRQSFQLHGVLKKNLKTTIRGINKTLLSTLAACGDVNRNVMVNPNPYDVELHDEIQEIANKVMLHFAPKTSAYHEIWLADELVAGHAVQDFEPIYGPSYLPRKFKMVFAVPPNNDVDVYAHDLGFIAIIENKKLLGFNIAVGGGMGMTHGNKKTYPRPASIIGFITPDQTIALAEAVVTTQRDNGDRLNRKHARLKYTIDDRGLDWFKGEVESRAGFKLAETRPFQFTDNADRYGWTKGVDDKWHFGMFIENGKVKDWPDLPVKTGLRELAKWHKGEFRLTPNQHLVIANVPEADLEKTKAHLAKYKIDNLSFTGLRLNAMACVALPTCGLAMAESERYLPTLVGLLEDTIEEAGLRDDAITIRMTGCPNGCARPYLAEIAFVGKAPGAYNVYLGGGHSGERLNKLYKESLREDEILSVVKPIIKRYALERNNGEPFGDWVIRAGYVKKTITGTDFHDL